MLGIVRRNKRFLKGTYPSFSTLNKNVIVFPGMGTHKAGMAKQFLDKPWAMKILKECDNLLKFPLSNIMINGTIEELTATEVCQPAIFINSYLLHQKAIIEKEIDDENTPIYIGHSLGEYTALAASGVFNPVELTKLLHERAKLVKQCCSGHHVGMLVVIDEYSGLELMIETIKALHPDKFCEVAAFNSKKQFILTGDLEIIDEIKKELATVNVKCARVNAKAAFHSHLLTPMKDKFRGMLQNIEFQASKKRVLRDIDAKEYKGKDDIIHGLVEQLDHPVKFKDMVEKCLAEKINTFYDVGSHGYMPPVLKMISNDITVHKIY